MSVGRYIRLALDVLTSDNALGEVSDRYHAAEGQRVESIRWCETHGESAVRDADGLLCNYCWGELHGDDGDCRIVEATLILPPRAEP